MMRAAPSPPRLAWLVSGGRARLLTVEEAGGAEADEEQRRAAQQLQEEQPGRARVEQGPAGQGDHGGFADRLEPVAAGVVYLEVVHTCAEDRVARATGGTQLDRRLAV